MSNLIAASSFDDVYQFDPTDPIQGGPGGIDNQPHQSLLNRTQWLKDNLVARKNPTMSMPGSELADSTSPGAYRFGVDLGLVPDAGSGTYGLIPLGRAISSATSLLQIINGRFRYVKGGNSYGGQVNQTMNVDVVYQTASGASGGSIRHQVGTATNAFTPAKLVFATIGGVVYICLTQGMANQARVYFDGFSYDNQGLDAILLTIIPNTSATNISDAVTSEYFGARNSLVLDQNSNMQVKGRSISLGTNGIAAVNVNDDNSLSLRGAQINLQNPDGSVNWATVAANGYFGVGTNNPQAQIHIFAGGSTRIRLQGSGVILDAIADPVNNIAALGSTSNHALNFTVNGTPRMVIDTSGQVNVGGLTGILGGYALAVNGALSFDNRAGINGIFGNANTTDYFAVDGNKLLANYGLSWKAFSDNQSAGSTSGVLTGYGGLRFYTQSTLRMAIQQDGSTGFGGFPTPNYKVDIAGSLRVIAGESSAAGYGIRLLNANASAGGHITVRAPGVAGGGMTIGADGGPLIFASAGQAESGRFDSSGNLVIGVPGNQITLNDFFTTSRSGNGYQRLPGGLTLQWGTVYIGDVISNGNRAYTANFPVAYPNACLHVQLSYYDAAQVSSAVFLQLIGYSTTTATFQINESSSSIQNASVFWFSIGY